MTEQTETTEIKMNVRNINVVTARSVLNKTRLDNFTHAVLSNCTTGIFLSVPKKFTPESLLHNFNIAAVGVMKIECLYVSNIKLIVDISTSRR
ncbi:conjugal transfer protein TrbD [Escherichia coli]|uniref:conjugal transfer protein TrbD n=2 Tax=Enterobacteriaceae TaxID=543 RepID=UPI0022AD5ADD|nr:conjugal transfer protein TrbD [Escherichia coli]MED0169533.1 conjugal transfer protein TrbD [Escherichia marmotae]HCW1557448.1 conjugal transfer protein TrbD [Escherichia coli]